MAVYLLLGDDEERKSRSIDRLRRSRSAETFDAAESGPEAVLSACNSGSLFGEGSFVVLQNLDAWNAAQKAKIVDYLQNPSEDTDLVLLGKKLGAREKLLAAVKKIGEVHEFEQPTGKALVRWIVSHAKKKGLDLPEQVAQNLAERSSNDKMRLVQEIEKLSLYVGEREATAEDIESLSPPDVRSNIFTFVDALAEGKRGEALNLLERLISTGEPPLRIVYMMRRQFRLLARAKAMFAGGAQRSEVAKELKVPPFVARKLEEQSRKLSAGDLDRALAFLLELECGLKGKRDLDEGLQIELAVMGLSK